VVVGFDGFLAIFVEGLDIVTPLALNHSSVEFGSIPAKIDITVVALWPENFKVILLICPECGFRNEMSSVPVRTFQVLLSASVAGVTIAFSG